MQAAASSQHFTNEITTTITKKTLHSEEKKHIISCTNQDRCYPELVEFRCREFFQSIQLGQEQRPFHRVEEGGNSSSSCVHKVVLHTKKNLRKRH